MLRNAVFAEKSAVCTPAPKTGSMSSFYSLKFPRFIIRLQHNPFLRILIRFIQEDRQGVCTVRVVCGDVCVVLCVWCCLCSVVCVLCVLCVWCCLCSVVCVVYCACCLCSVVCGAVCACVRRMFFSPPMLN